MTLRDRSDSVYQGGPGQPLPSPRPLTFMLVLTDYSPGGLTAELRLEEAAGYLGRVTLHPDDLGGVLSAMLRAWLHPGTYQQ